MTERKNTSGTYLINGEKREATEAQNLDYKSAVEDAEDLLVFKAR